LFFSHLLSSLALLPFLDPRQRRLAREGNAVHQLVEGVEDGAEVLCARSHCRPAEVEPTHSPTASGWSAR
ncbi:hypothetical protein PENTCL1PPCAC_13639, partial [Pristionchus entomophagus]